MRNYVRSELGASAPEYALLLAIVGGAIAAAVVALGASISSAFGDAGDNILSRGGSDSSPGNSPNGPPGPSGNPGNAGNNGNGPPASPPGKNK